jgi:chromosomal replication initiation ATPase DnaA
VVERVKRERWEAFRDRYGDWGRDLALWAGRQYAGLTLRELGDRAGGADYTAVAMAIRRLPPHARRNRSLRDAMRRVAKKCEK